jgi:esterase
MHAVDLDQVKNRNEVDTTLAPTINERPIRLFLLQNLEQSESPFRWHINLPILHAAMDNLMGFPDFALDSTFTGPTSILYGDNSDYVLKCHHSSITKLFPSAMIKTVSDSGHWLHVEKPIKVVSEAKRFFG